MVDLGMTPILPAFTGFVPRSISSVHPNASVVNGSQWEGFPYAYTNVTFLNPSENLELFTSLQQDFIARQRDAYGNITSFYTLDQYNENDPSSGDLDFLSNLTHNTWQTLKAADPNAIWVMQAWLFNAAADFWHNDRIEAYLGGVPNSDMLLLDLASESNPQWQRTNSYFGKPWIWCELHDYGGNLGLYGQVMNLTINSLEALKNSSSLVGFGLSMEAQEGNEIIYDLLLDQAWSNTSIDTDMYFHDWVTTRYNTGKQVSSNPPPRLYEAWDRMRTTVYNNTNVTSYPSVQKSLLELSPALNGLYNKTGRHGTTITYDPQVLNEAWTLFYAAAEEDPTLWNKSSAFAFDMVDLSRQILANEFTARYLQLVTTYNSTANNSSTTFAQNITDMGSTMLSLLSSLDAILDTNPHFRLATWLNSAEQWASPTVGTGAGVAAPPGSSNSSSNTDDGDNLATAATYFDYNARNQITLWGPTGQVNDYASKSWSGMVASYYLPRWSKFIDYVSKTDSTSYNQTEFTASLLAFEEQWQLEKAPNPAQSSMSNQTDGGDGTGVRLRDVLTGQARLWPELFATA